MLCICGRSKFHIFDLGGHWIIAGISIHGTFVPDGKKFWSWEPSVSLYIAKASPFLLSCEGVCLGSAAQAEKHAFLVMRACHVVLCGLRGFNHLFLWNVHGQQAVMALKGKYLAGLHNVWRKSRGKRLSPGSSSCRNRRLLEHYRAFGDH